MNKINEYLKFVDKLTSVQSKDFTKYIDELTRLRDSGCDIPRLDMAITGLMAESGEAQEILKKLKFQGKEWNKDVHFHLKREAGDIVFYWINLCIALDLEPLDVISENIKKLESRYPGGTFSDWHSDNRKDGDI